MKHIFVTGAVGAGKTTLVNRLVSTLSMPVFGFATKKEAIQTDGWSPVYIYPYGSSQPARTQKNRIAWCSSECVCLNTYSLDTYGCSLLCGIPSNGITVMDELGAFESNAPQFRACVMRALDSDNMIIGALKARSTPFLDAVRAHKNVSVYELTPDTREEVFASICRDIGLADIS